MVLSKLWDGVESVWNSTIGGVDDIFDAVVGIGKVLLGFFTEFENILDIFVGLFNLVKEIFMGGIVFVKSVVDVLMNALDLMQEISEFIVFMIRTLSEYIHIPVVMFMLVPLYISSYYMIDVIDAVVNLI
jgi:hypothetical protein